MNAPRRAALATIGCRVNQYETQLIREELELAGYEIVPFSCLADIYVVNTCTVTHQADKKSVALIRRALRNSPDSQVFATGCLVELDGTERARICRGLFSGHHSSDWAHRVRFVPNCRKFTLDSLVPANVVGEVVGIHDFSGHDRAFVKVEDGCDQYCSYCRIPYVRGDRIRSKKPESVVSEVQDLITAGYREVVLTGVNLALYGKDLDGEISLTDLIDDLLAKVKGEGFRMRLGSLEPHLLPNRLLELIASSSIMCPHLHLSFQNGSDAILHLMRRPYSARFVRELVDQFRATSPMGGVTGDVIVGFPGESQQDFQANLDFIRDVGFHRLHVFRFSSRVGTVAASMTGQLPERVKYERARQLRLLAQEVSGVLLRRFVGKVLPVLIESQSDRATGLPAGYAHNYARVIVSPVASPRSHSRIATGQICRVRVIREQDGYLVGVED